MAKTLSLITGRKPQLTTTNKAEHCKHCNKNLPSGSKCAKIPESAGFSNKPAYCLICLKEIIGQTRFDLNELEKSLTYFTSEE
jgi:hypothetical protein